MKKILAIVLAAAMMLSLAACGSSSSGSGSSTAAASTAATDTKSEAKSDTAAPADTAAKSEAAPAGETTAAEGEKSITLGVNDVLSTLSPWVRISEGRHVIIYSLYQPLMERDKATGEVRMILAKEFEKDPDDSFSFIITLEDGIVDAAGNEFTASDAVYSITTCLELGNVNGLSNIDHAEVIDGEPLKLKVVMKTDTEFQFASCMSSIMMVTQAAYEASEDEMSMMPVSTAPYEVVDFEAGSTITIQAKENYWGADLGKDTSKTGWRWFAQNVDTVKYMKISEATQQVGALEQGTIDGEELMSQANAMKFDGNADYNVFETTDVKTYFLYFNCGELSQCSDENLRKAIAYAINVDDLIIATGGTGVKAYTFGSPQYSDYDQAWANEDYYEKNIETAKEYLAKSSYDGSELRLYMSNGDENNKLIANLVQANCLEAGINIRIDGVDSASFSSSAFDPTVQDLRLDCKGFENLADLWKQDLCPVKSITDSAGNQLNHVFNNDEELISLIDGMRFDDNHTAENIEAAKEYINEHMFAYGIFSKNIYDVTSQKIKTLERTTKLYILPGACEYDWTK